jgi:4-hydroxythreonine-4-phosphate dehydrogenase
VSEPSGGRQEGAVDLRPLAFTTGDPGGVGPEISLRALQALQGTDRVVLFGDARALRERGRALGLATEAWLDVDPNADFPRAEVGLVDAGVAWAGEALRHQPTALGGAASLAALDAAIAAALSGRVRGIVTAPISKAAVNLAGREFTGHTEHLARAAKLADDDVTMMFLGPRLRVALVTTHVSIAALPAAITQARVLRSITHLGQAILRARPSADSPARLVVAGLNPHAGEAGLFGDDELRSIGPAIDQARALPLFRSGNLRLEGPIGAETAFREAASGRVDGVVAMMHDQATIASKLLDWTRAVNVTWGLPFVRTSVDHGVAYDAARAASADPQGMISAVAMAQLLTGPSTGPTSR